MADRPIIFSGPMVRALLEGRKTQTRRIIKPQPFPVGGPFYRPFPVLAPQLWYSANRSGIITNIQKVPYAPGDRLWVREALAVVANWGVFFAASHPDETGFIDDRDKRGRAILERYGSFPDATEEKRVPSIHMPRWASRMTLTVTEVRVQRLQEIDHLDAEQEGVKCDMSPRTFVDHFRILWESIHGPGSWKANPWVTAISFTVEHRNIDAEAK